MTKIQWTEATWNPVVGCSPVSEGCRNCYAARLAIRLGANPQTAHAYAGTAEMRGLGSKRRAVFTSKVRLLEDRLHEPLHWRKPRLVFVDSMSDLFHEAVPDEYIDRVFAAMALAPHHTFQILTKRPERMAEYFHDLKTNKRVATTAGYSTEDSDEVPWRRWPLPNVWLGASVEDQDAADERVPHLLRTPAAVRFLSCEPLLGPVDLNSLDPWPRYDYRPTYEYYRIATGNPDPRPVELRPGINWVIVGGESGPGARPMDVAWARSLVEQCRAAEVPVFYKQGGAANACEHNRKGGCFDCAPEDLRVREFPEVTP